MTKKRISVTYYSSYFVYLKLIYIGESINFNTYLSQLNLSTPILASLQVGMGAKHFPSTGMRHVESGSGKQRPIVCDGDAVAPQRRTQHGKQEMAFMPEAAWKRYTHVLRSKQKAKSGAARKRGA